MPGLGKTQLALKYALSTFKEKRYQYIFWISAASTEKVNYGMAKMLDLIRYPGRASMDQAARVTAARLWLEDDSSEATATRKWLLVFDNANYDTARHLREVFPQRNSNGSMLMTTRTKAVAESLAAASGIKHGILALEQPSSDDAVALLLASAEKDSKSDPSLLDTAEGIVQSIGCLPLAVDQAASYLKESGCSGKELLDIYKSEQKEKVRLQYFEKNGLIF
jgi:hypothetical protein